MMNENRSLKAVSFVNIVTISLFLYGILHTSLPHSKNTKDPIVSETDRIFFNNTLVFSNRFQEEITRKLYLDLYSHKIIQFEENQAKYVTQISVNKEGKILGYKSSQLRMISYSLEKQLMNFLSKNMKLAKINKNIYWLNITNKY